MPETQTDTENNRLRDGLLYGGGKEMIEACGFNVPLDAWNAFELWIAIIGDPILLECAKLRTVGTVLADRTRVIHDDFTDADRAALRDRVIEILSHTRGQQ